MKIDDIIWLAFVIVFVVVAAARKLSEQRQIEKRQREAPQRKPEDMPEPTRRMIYGTDVPTAKPRTSSRESGGARRTEFDVPTAKPKEGQPRRVVPPPVAPRQAPPRPVRPAPAPQRTAPPPRPHPVKGPTPFRPAEEQRRLAPEQRRQAPPMVPRGKSQRRREAPAPVRQPAETPAAKMPSRGITVAPPMQLAHGRVHPRHIMFSDMSELRRAIVLREVLGPPKAFE